MEQTTASPFLIPLLIWEMLAPILVLILAPLVSLAYFLASPRSESVRRRLLVSAHGAVIASVWLVVASIGERPAWGTAFTLLMLVPLALIGFSFFAFRGRPSVHILQVVNLVALGWTYFIGSMSITGKWL
jgi:hypothetical protein